MGRTAKKDKNLAAGQPAKPPALSPEAAREWDRIMGELAASQIQVTPAHRATISTAAKLAADIARAWTRSQKDGEYITTKAGLVQHPAAKRLDALRRDYIKVLTMLGIRSAVAGEPVKDEETLGDIIGG